MEIVKHNKYEYDLHLVNIFNILCHLELIVIPSAISSMRGWPTYCQVINCEKMWLWPHFCQGAVQLDTPTDSWNNFKSSKLDSFTQLTSSQKYT